MRRSRFCRINVCTHTLFPGPVFHRIGPCIAKLRRETTSRLRNRRATKVQRRAPWRHALSHRFFNALILRHSDFLVERRLMLRTLRKGLYGVTCQEILATGTSSKPNSGGLKYPTGKLQTRTLSTIKSTTYRASTWNLAAMRRLPNELRAAEPGTRLSVDRTSSRLKIIGPRRKLKCGYPTQIQLFEPGEIG